MKVRNPISNGKGKLSCAISSKVTGDFFGQVELTVSINSRKDAFFN